MEQKENSVSIIEDCLTKIYQSRKANLISKSRKFKEKQSRREYQNNYDKPHDKIMIDDYEEEYNLRDEYSQDGEVLEELSTKFRAPPVHAVPYEKERSRVALEYEQQDIIAEGVLEEFSIDIKQFVQSNHLKLSDEELRADACDNFIDKYLTQRLDHCVTTRIVSKIRKKISNIIEYIASCDSPKELIAYLDQELNVTSNSGTTTASNADDNAKIQGISNNSANSKLSSNELKKTITNDNHKHTATNSHPSANTVTASMNKPTGSSSSVTSGKNMEHSMKESREQMEKRRIKEQYEQLMALKKKAEAHPDDTAISQHAALHNDIQSVIDSIKNNKPMK